MTRAPSPHQKPVSILHGYLSCDLTKSEARNRIRIRISLMAVCALPGYQSCRKYNVYSNILWTLCDHLNTFTFSTRQTCIVLKSSWSSAARMPASSLVLLPYFPLTRRLRRQVDGQLSPLYPPSPSFSSFGAACVNEALLSSSRVRNTRLCCLISVWIVGNIKVVLPWTWILNRNIIFADTVDALTATFAVWTRPWSKGGSSATNHG